MAAPAAAGRPSPAAEVPEAPLTAEERRESAALMRVNHAGEVAAQALYNGQSLLARSAATRDLLDNAAREERDHLAWCAARLDELGSAPSMLTPFWYAGSYCIGVLAAVADDARSLGFVSETERQVEMHLRDHLERLPAQDRRSAAILTRMTQDEAHHGTSGARRWHGASGRDSRLHGVRRRNLAARRILRVTGVSPSPINCLRAVRELIKYSVKSNRSSDVWSKKPLGP
jgi:ubiquinone biosynthesis monooxygenase Coq7